MSKENYRDELSLYGLGKILVFKCTIKQEVVTMRYARITFEFYWNCRKWSVQELRLTLPWTSCLGGNDRSRWYIGRLRMRTWTARCTQTTIIATQLSFTLQDK